MGQHQRNKASGKGLTMGRHRDRCPHGYPLTTTSRHRCRAIRRQRNKAHQGGARGVKRARSRINRQKSGNSSAARRLAGRRRENRRGNNARNCSRDSAPAQPAEKSHMSQQAASGDHSTIRIDPDHVRDNLQPRATQTDTGSQDDASQSQFSKVAVYLGYALGPDCAETFCFSDEDDVGWDTGPPSGYSKEGIEAWLHSTKVPDRPDWERLSTDRLRLPVHISPMDTITETAVAINAARESLTLASRSEDTAEDIESTSSLVIRTLALCLGISSGRIALRNLPDLAQRLIDPEGEIEEAVWEHLDPEHAETCLDNLGEELEEMVEREEMKMEAESFEMRTDYEWGHFPGMGGVARELGIDEEVKPRGGDVSIPGRDIVGEADMLQTEEEQESSEREEEGSGEDTEGQ